METELQGGQLNKENGAWTIKTSTRGTQDSDGNVITAISGPYEPRDDRQCNRTGFIFVNSWILLRLRVQ
jgi:hypothetical protein